MATNSGGAPNVTDALLTFTPTASGTFGIKVTGNEAGQFVLDVTGASTAAPAFTAAAKHPIAESAVQSASEPYEVTFSNTVDLRASRLWAAAMRARDFSLKQNGSIFGLPFLGVSSLDLGRLRAALFLLD